MADAAAATRVKGKGNRGIRRSVCIGIQVKRDGLDIAAIRSEGNVLCAVRGNHVAAKSGRHGGQQLFFELVEVRHDDRVFLDAVTVGINVMDCVQVADVSNAGADANAIGANAVGRNVGKVARRIGGCWAGRVARCRIAVGNEVHDVLAAGIEAIFHGCLCQGQTIFIVRPPGRRQCIHIGNGILFRGIGEAAVVRCSDRFEADQFDLDVCGLAVVFGDQRDQRFLGHVHAGGHGYGAIGCYRLHVVRHTAGCIDNKYQGVLRQHALGHLNREIGGSRFVVLDGDV